MSPRLFLIAGEPSGDRLGGALMGALKTLDPGIVFGGVGGRTMRAEGLQPLFDIAQLSVMGITEVLPRLPGILARMREATEAAIAFRPDALITIDAPSFTRRVAGRVRRRAPGIRTMHYVAPTVWAWRPGRAARMARAVDHVLALLPFEPPYMTAAGMTCDFVGHPIAGLPVAGAADIAAFRMKHDLGDAPLLLMAPGSRVGEVTRMSAAFRETLGRLQAERPGLRGVVPVAETVSKMVAELFPGVVLVAPDADPAERRAATAACRAALLKSGTVTVETAAQGVPQVAAYRASWLTATIARRLIRIDTANMVNLAYGWDNGERPIPEFYQDEMTPEALSGALRPLLDETPERAAQVAAADGALRALGRGGEAPALRAARSVMVALGRQPSLADG
ncbi:MAG: lipid-A-disaccharide synthase [Pseudomonadota bacterium]